MTATDPADGGQPAVDRRNYRLGLLNGIAFGIGEVISSPSLVLSLLVRQLGGSIALVGLMPVIQNVGYLLPQLLVAGRVQAQPYRLPLYRRAGVIRLLAQCAFIGATLAAAVVPHQWALALIIACYAVFNFGGGVTTLSFQEVVAKVIPLRRRGAFFGTRQLVGGLVAFVIGGTFVRWLLGEHAPLAFPYNFALLGALSLVGFTIGIASFGMVREPPSHVTAAHRDVRDIVRRAPQILRDSRDYRLFIAARILVRSGQIAEPFYIIYATEVLGLSPGVAGVLVATWALAAALSNVVWGRVADRHGNRRLLLLAGSLMMLAPVLMVLIPLVAHPTASPALLTVALALVALCSGAGNDGVMIAAMTYLIEVSPEAERATYLGVANTILGIGAFLPLLGSGMIVTLGYQATFGIGAILAITAVVVLTRLREPRQLSGGTR
jgi:MFS family permease